MRLLMFGMTEEEQKLAAEFLPDGKDFKIDFADGVLDAAAMKQVAGYDAVSILSNSQIGEKEAKQLREAGVKYITTRSTGIDHIDRNALKQYGLKAANVPSYSPNAISEHTILLFLAALRNIKRSQHLTENQDYGINGLRGREIRMMTVGVIGAGKIGTLTIRALHGFGARVLVNAPHERKEVSKIAQYVSLDELYRQSDAILLHCPLTDENYHMINEDTITKCKDNLILVNTARGGLIDGKAVLKTLQCGKIQTFAMDVYETENLFVRKSFHDEEFPDSIFQELCSREDVIYTSHIGFLTDQACMEMIKITLENVEEYAKCGSCKNEIVK